MTRSIRTRSPGGAAKPRRSAEAARLAVGLSAAVALSSACRGARPVPSEDPDAGAAAAAVGVLPAPGRVERGGLAITFELRPLSGPVEAHGEATAAFTVANAATGAPARGLRPLAWMSRRGDEGALDDAACNARVKSYMSGLISARADVDMSAYHLWVLSGDGTISVIDPTTAFARTKMETLISLPGRPNDWAMAPDGGSAYVTIPEMRLVSVVDVRRRLALARVSVGEGPSRLAVAPDGRTVWVGNDGDGSVSVIDATSNTVRKTLAVGAGHHEIAFAEQGSTVWITSSGAESVTAVDAQSLEVLGAVAVGPGASSIAASDAARSVFVANERIGEVAVVDAAHRAIMSRIPLAPGLAAVRFEPAGRFAFAVNRARGEVAILDAATGQVAHRLTGMAKPDSIAFTREFAYVRHLGAGKMSVIELNTIDRASAPVVVEIPVGQAPPGSAELGLAAPIAPTPEGNSVMVANPADGNLYYYVEGMMAPLGTHRSYSRSPQGITIAPRTLRESEPGVYEAAIRLKGAGLYDVALLLPGSRSAACLELSVPAAAGREPEEGAPRLTLEPLFDTDALFNAREPATLRFRLRDEAASEAIPANDIEIVIGRFPGSPRFRRSPRDEGEGVYSVTFTPPAPGQYRFLAAVEAKKAPLGTIPYLVVGVVDAIPAKASGR